jgi:hypothetical protein
MLLQAHGYRHGYSFPMTKPGGYVLYEGPSELDGFPIVVIATMSTANAKTGDMVQTWILRSDMSPVEASKVGADASICGDCPQRWHLGGACYVNIGQAPGAVYRAYKRGAYPLGDPATVGEGRKVRLGAYGDPAAVPATVWRALVSRALGHTGYTHQWRHAPLRDLCMASVDTQAEWEAAQRTGWRTFRVTSPTDLLEPGEIECPSDARGKTCAQCMACDGAPRGNGQVSIAITVHGPNSSRFKGDNHTAL